MKTIIFFIQIALILSMTGCASDPPAPLTMAIWSGDISTARHLIDQGVSVNTHDFRGWSPLCDAASKDNADIANSSLKRVRL